MEKDKNDIERLVLGFRCPTGEVHALKLEFDKNLGMWVEKDKNDLGRLVLGFRCPTGEVHALKFEFDISLGIWTFIQVSKESPLDE